MSAKAASAAVWQPWQPSKVASTFEGCQHTDDDSPVNPEDCQLRVIRQPSPDPMTEQERRHVRE